MQRVRALSLLANPAPWELSSPLAPPSVVHYYHWRGRARQTGYARSLSDVPIAGDFPELQVLKRDSGTLLACKDATISAGPAVSRRSGLRVAVSEARARGSARERTSVPSVQERLSGYTASVVIQLRRG